MKYLHTLLAKRKKRQKLKTKKVTVFYLKMDIYHWWQITPLKRIVFLTRQRTTLIRKIYPHNKKHTHKHNRKTYHICK